MFSANNSGFVFDKYFTFQVPSNFQEPLVTLEHSEGVIIGSVSVPVLSNINFINSKNKLLYLY